MCSVSTKEIVYEGPIIDFLAKLLSKSLKNLSSPNFVLILWVARFDSFCGNILLCGWAIYGQLFYHLLLPTEPHQESPESSLCFYSLCPHPPSFLPWYIFTEHNISPDPPLRKHEQWMICLLYKSDKPVISDLQKLCGKSSWWINRWIFVATGSD